MNSALAQAITTITTWMRTRSSPDSPVYDDAIPSIINEINKTFQFPTKLVQFVKLSVDEPVSYELLVLIVTLKNVLTRNPREVTLVDFLIYEMYKERHSANIGLSISKPSSVTKEQEFQFRKESQLSFLRDHAFRLIKDGTIVKKEHIDLIYDLTKTDYLTLFDQTYIQEILKNSETASSHPICTQFKIDQPLSTIHRNLFERMKHANDPRLGWNYNSDGILSIFLNKKLSFDLEKDGFPFCLRDLIDMTKRLPPLSYTMLKILVYIANKDPASPHFIHARNMFLKSQHFIYDCIPSRTVHALVMLLRQYEEEMATDSFIGELYERPRNDVCFVSRDEESDPLYLRMIQL